MAAEHSRKWRQNNPESYKEGMKKQWQIIKFRMQTDPEFAAKRKRQRADSQRKRYEKIKADPEQYAILLEKVSINNKKYRQSNPEKMRLNEARRQHRNKEKLKLEQLENAQQIKLKTLQNTLLSPEQKKAEHRRVNKEWKKKKNAEFLELYGFSYYAYTNAKDRHGLNTIEEVIEYRIENNLYVKQAIRDKTEPIVIMPKYKKKISITQIPVIDEDKPKNKLMQFKQSKEQAYRNIQLRIIDLERILSSQPHELKIRVDYLRNQFVSQYGAMPI